METRKGKLAGRLEPFAEQKGESERNEETESPVFPGQLTAKKGPSEDNDDS
jgi:hypothetical protein